MGLNSTGKFLLKNISNIPGWQTKRHLIVFESDDWGSIRTSNIEAVDRLVGKGIDFTSLDAKRYSYNDSLATADDLEELFNVLLSSKDLYNSPAVFTAISLVANPDFEAIRENGFKKYIYEPITQTMKRNPGCENSYSLWKKGISQGIFIPQFHGREHLNIASWMNALQQNHSETLDVFSEGMWGYVNNYFNGRKINYQEAFNLHDPAEISILEEVITDGLKLFENLFGYRAKLFVAPNGPFPNTLEKSLASNGVMYITQSKIQNEPVGFGKTKKRYHYLGQMNRWGQIYITRNCFFEPSSPEKNDWVNSCLHDIETSFRWNKPAVISSHRVNYVGKLNAHNRGRGLGQLKELLTQMRWHWPDIEFISSDQLGSIILADKYQ